MENMTIEEKADEYIKQYLPHVNTTGHWLGFQDGYKQALAESSGSVAAPKELNEDQKLVHEVHEAHDLAGNAIDKLFDRLSSLKELVREREEALKELLTIAERKFNSISIDDAASHREYIALKAIIERARKLLSK